MTLSELANRSTLGLSLMLSGIGTHFLTQAWQGSLGENSPLQGVALALIIIAVAIALSGSIIYLRAAFGSPREQRLTLKADEWQQRVGHRSTSIAFTLVLFLLAGLEVAPASWLPEAESLVRIVFGTAMLSAGVAMFVTDRTSR